MTRIPMVTTTVKITSSGGRRTRRSRTSDGGERATTLIMNAITVPSATKANVVGRMHGQRIIHLATHGLLDLVGYGMPGAVALTPSAGDDGLLYLDRYWKQERELADA